MAGARKRKGKAARARAEAAANEEEAIHEGEKDLQAEQKSDIASIGCQGSRARSGSDDVVVDNDDRSAAKEPADKEATSVVAACAEDLKKEGSSRREDAYSASSVVFFTRDAEGKVAKVLMAVEERKVQASYIGLKQQGKVVKKMVLFPMGRRERKDKGDTVETAKREYVEETGDFGGLSKYLDFADFSGAPPDEQLLQEQSGGGRFWTGRANMAVFFTPASMINLFCEVPAETADSSKRRATGGVPLREVKRQERAAAEAAAARAAAEEAERRRKEELAASTAAADAEGPAKKKRKKERPPPVVRSTPNFAVGRTDHLDPIWVDADDLRAAVLSMERSPAFDIDDEEHRVFPVAASVLRLAEVRQWLGLPPHHTVEKSDGKEPRQDSPPATAESA